jgi:DNA-binding MarR family transcriptional regulator
MSSPATLLAPREGRTQTDILGELAQAQFADGEQLRQRELVERLPHSKGAISNNVGKLVDTGLVTKEDHRYLVDEAALLALYREHVDSFLARERANGPFDAELESINEQRTETKRQLLGLFEGNDLLVSVLATAFTCSTEASHLRTVPDVCHYADELVQHAATRIVTSDAFSADAIPNADLQTLLRLAVVLDRTRSGLTRLVAREDVLAEYMPGSPPTQTMLTILNRDSTQ